MADLSALVAELAMGKGWPRDYSEVKVPCWYLMANDSPIDDIRIEDPDFAPDLTGRPGRVAIWPTGPFALYVDVDASGRLGETNVFVHDGQIESEADLGPITPWPGLDAALLEATALYVAWEAETLREHQTA